MIIAYRVGYPGWKIAARLGFPLKVLVKVMYDKEAGVYAARTEDFKPYLGISTEGETVEQLNEKLEGLFEEGMLEALHRQLANRVISILILTSRL